MTHRVNRPSAPSAERDPESGILQNVEHIHLESEDPDKSHQYICFAQMLAYTTLPRETTSGGPSETASPDEYYATPNTAWSADSAQSQLRHAAHSRA